MRIFVERARRYFSMCNHGQPAMPSRT
jgi:hypothetical protein